ncbi:glycosyltransferase family 2 protein [Candidatus Woesearchaeota archaeon]|nr:glycosyltransferase family 2 protein [Candidatus Woesearchaeota archaeon]
MKAARDIWVVIPAYNEANHLAKVIAGVKRYATNIAVVDDGSSDSTYGVAKRAGVHALRHIVNLGKGAALKTGCDFAVQQGASCIIAIDADGQHDPKDIPRFLDELRNADIVFGYRRFSADMPLILKFGNIFISAAASVLYGLKLRDTQCGYRAFTAAAYKKIRWKSLDYGVESEMIANAGKHNLKYAEVGIKTIYSDKYKGTTVLDGIKIVFNMLLWKLRASGSNGNGV